jgi:hypothetical protein
VTGSKEVRADPFAAQAEARNVRLVRGPWNGAYLDELTIFPNGANDDVVDASSGAFAKLGSAPRKLQMRVYNFGAGRHAGLRIVACSTEELASLAVEGRGLLVSIRDPGKREAMPANCLDPPLGSACLAFADLDPEAGECGQCWDRPYGFAFPNCPWCICPSVSIHAFASCGKSSKIAGMLRLNIFSGR